MERERPLGEAEPAPEAIREGVRSGVVDALAEEVDRTSARTAARLLVAGLLGLGGAALATALFAGPAFAPTEGRDVPGLHVALCAAAWSGLLVECFALVLLRIQSRRLPLAQSAAVALLGLALAAGLALACPSPHHLEWWSTTVLGGLAASQGGHAGSALCLGLCTTVVVATAASLLVALRGMPMRDAHLPAFLLFLVLWPAVALQSMGAHGSVFAAWSLGVVLGAWGGVATGLRIPRLRRRASPAAAR